MNLLCKYYSNQARLANSVEYLSNQPSFRFFCVSGMIVKNKKTFDVVTDTVTLVVACVLPGTGKNSMMLLTSDPALRDKDGEPVDMLKIEYDPIYYNLCVLLQEKFKASNNPVTIEFRGDKHVTAVTISEETKGELQCNVRGSEGDMVVNGVANIRATLGHCISLHSLKYAVSTPESQRIVTVSCAAPRRKEDPLRGRTDLLREIAKYLNRTLVLVAFTPEGDMLEQYVGSNALLEVVTKQDGTKIYKKVTSAKLRNADSFCVYQTVSTVNDILLEQGKALHTDKRG